MNLSQNWASLHLRDRTELDAMKINGLPLCLDGMVILRWVHMNHLTLDAARGLVRVRILGGDGNGLRPVREGGRGAVSLRRVGAEAAARASGVEHEPPATGRRQPSMQFNGRPLPRLGAHTRHPRPAPRTRHVPEHHGSRPRPILLIRGYAADATMAGEAPTL